MSNNQYIAKIAKNIVFWLISHQLFTQAETWKLFKSHLVSATDGLCTRTFNVHTPLTRPEEMNVKADFEASTAILEQTVFKRKYEFIPLPNTNCYLKHNGIYVVNNEKDILLWARAELDIQHFYRQKHNWGRSIPKTIDWCGFQSAIKPLRQYAFYTKLCGGWLASLSVLGKREPIPTLCPACRITETNDHVFTCPCRHIIHEKFKSHLNNKFINMRTSPQIRDEIIDAISAVQQGKHFQPRSPAGHEQQRIGWLNMYRGFFSSKWAIEQDKYSSSLNNAETSKTKGLWNTMTIRTFLIQAHRLWINRCEFIHNKISKYETEQQQRRAHSKVRGLYKLKTEISTFDQEMFFGTDLQEKLKQSASSLLIWCDSILPALQRAIADNKKENATQPRLDQILKLRHRHSRLRRPRKSKNKTNITKPQKRLIQRSIKTILHSFTSPNTSTCDKSHTQRRNSRIQSSYTNASTYIQMEINLYTHGDHPT